MSAATKKPNRAEVDSIDSTNSTVIDAASALAQAGREQAVLTADALALYDATSFLRASYTVVIGGFAARLAGEAEGKDSRVGLDELREILNQATEQWKQVRSLIAED